MFAIIPRVYSSKSKSYNSKHIPWIQSCFSLNTFVFLAHALATRVLPQRYNLEKATFTYTKDEKDRGH